LVDGVSKFVLKNSGDKLFPSDELTGKMGKWGQKLIFSAAETLFVIKQSRTWDNIRKIRWRADKSNNWSYSYL
jgi:hypothetical protein